MDLTQLLVVIKGAGEMASGVAWRLRMANLRVVLTERENPLAVRRRVSFCEAVHDGTSEVEGVRARRIADVSRVPGVLSSGDVPVLVDPEMKCLKTLQPQVLVEATLSKRNTGIRKDAAPLVIALGPGFTAGVDAHMVIETKRGHNLGRIITRGKAEPNTGIPGDIAGETVRRVLRAPADGEFITDVDIGAVVTAGQTVATVAGLPVTAQLGGVLRGLIRPGSMITKGVKVGDVDPRGDPSYVDTISEKARALGGSVLEAIMRVFNR